MLQVNEHYLKLQASYLFSDIAKRVAAFQAAHPEREVIKLGIGDVTNPLPPACIEAFHKAVDEMGTAAGFRGYGPEQGYDFLREAIAAHDFRARGALVEADEVFVSDGAKCDTGNIQELFSTAAKIAIPDPVYPVYLDTNVMAGRTGAYRDGRYEGIVYLDSTRANNFVPELPTEPVDLIYLCFPNNPTGSTITREQLKVWVDFARDSKALILFDAAYEAFLRDPDLPHSIYEIPGAREVPLSSAASPRAPASPVPAAPTRWCPRSAWPSTPRATGRPSTRCGTGVIAPSSTVFPIRCSGPPRRSTHLRARPSVRP